MRRADRLFQMVNYLRSARQAVTARRLAEEFEICERTVYRDIQDLQGSGVPIHGEAGVGYLMDRHYNLPPLAFDIEEIEALVLGVGVVGSWTDRAFARASKRALQKIKNAVSEPLREALEETALFSPSSPRKPALRVDFSQIRRAIRQRKKIRLAYTTLAGKKSKRTIRPLALAFFPPTWLLLGWCEMRKDFRNFRLDRIHSIRVARQSFQDEKGKRLKDYLEQMSYKNELLD